MLYTIFALRVGDCPAAYLWWVFYTEYTYKNQFRVGPSVQIAEMGNYFGMCKTLKRDRIGILRARNFANRSRNMKSFFNKLLAKLYIV